MSVAAALDPLTLPLVPSNGELVEHRNAMMRFARRRIRDEALAEDAVQDALVAALASRQSFRGTSALRTWLIGILNHKIQDVFRRETRYVKLATGGEDAGGDEPAAGAAASDASGADDPLAQVSARRMHAALSEEVERLPASLKSVFLLQAVEGVETAEVCRQLSITEANCWVRLHRARKRLSERLRDHLEPG
jgi:RNA polymerase sigma-70 factor, ECF subfamily